MNILINNKTVTAIIDGAVYTRTFSEDEIKEITKLVFTYQTDQSESNKKSIKDFLSFDKDTKEKISTITEKTETIQKDIEANTAEIEKKNVKVLDNPYPKRFKIISGSFFMIGFEKVQLPDELVKKFIECKTNGEDPESLFNFWKLCLLNPDPEARQGLFKFIQRQKLIVTPRGYIVCYRQLVKMKQGENQKLVNFVFEEAVRLKKQKASLSKYSVTIIDDEYVTMSHATKKFENFDGQVLGTVSELADLYKNKSMSGEFTDNHTKTMKISLGEAVRIPRKDCDKNPHQTCSSGLHVGTPSFLSGGSFGNSCVLVLVNPAHVVSVPYTDAHKMRVCEYYPCYEIKLEVIKDLNDSSLVTYEDDYCEYEIDQVEKILGNKIFDIETFEDENLKMSKEKRAKLMKEKEEYLKKKEELMRYFSINDDVKDGLDDIIKIKELMKSRVITSKKR